MRSWQSSVKCENTNIYCKFFIVALYAVLPYVFKIMISKRKTMFRSVDTVKMRNINVMALVVLVAMYNGLLVTGAAVDDACKCVNLV